MIKKTVIAALIGFTIFAFINLTFIQGITYAPYNQNLGALLVVGFCIYCLNELFKATTFLEIAANPALWICIGLLIFYATAFPIWAATYVLLNIPGEEWEILGIALNIANLLLYSSFTIAFICGTSSKKRSN